MVDEVKDMSAAKISEHVYMVFLPKADFQADYRDDVADSRTYVGDISPKDWYILDYTR